MAEIFLENMDDTFDKPGDAFQINFLGESARHKWIHSVAQVSKINWVSVGSHPYTGMFKGSKYGYVRLSSGIDPGPDN